MLWVQKAHTHAPPLVREGRKGSQDKEELTKSGLALRPPDFQVRALIPKNDEPKPGSLSNGHKLVPRQKHKTYFINWCGASIEFFFFLILFILVALALPCCTDFL